MEIGDEYNGCCPKCGSNEDIEYEDEQDDEFGVYYECHCLSCEAWFRIQNKTILVEIK